MTAIAYRDGVMAGDTQAVYADHHKTHHVKVFKHRGWLYGASGDCPEAADLKAWLFKGLKDPRKKRFNRAAFANRDFDVLAVSPTGEICYIRHVGDLEIVPSAFFAVGSGKEFCMGAMAAGLSAHDAVALAVMYCDGCGGEVTTVRLGK